ncbi:MAG TPA: acyltransferase [Leptolyngbyaceae cyanobacterium]
MFGAFRLALAFIVFRTHTASVAGGVYAVFAFFVLSGYLMTLVMHKSYGYSIGGRLRFLLNRFLRIYPPYWVALIGTLALMLLMGETVWETSYERLRFPETLADWFKNVFLAFRPFPPETIFVPPAWALSVELFWYLAICLGASRTRRRCLIWLIGSLLYSGTAWYMGVSWEDRYASLQAASLPFALGSALFFIPADLKWSLSIPVWLLAELLLGNFVIGNAQGLIFGLYFYLNIFLSACLVLTLSNYRGGKLDAEMGSLSYPLYLLHWPVSVVIGHLLGLGKGYPLFWLSVPVALAVSWLVVRCVEAPVERLRGRVKPA